MFATFEACLRRLVDFVHVCVHAETIRAHHTPR
jgi:hypothetical protein